MGITTYTKLKSTGDYQLYEIDEYNISGKNAGIGTTCYFSEFGEGTPAGMTNSSIVARITNDGKLHSYNNIDEVTLTGLNPPGVKTVWSSLISLAQDLDGTSYDSNVSSGPTPQSTIENADTSFNCFAVVIKGNIAEALSSIAAAGGTTTFSGAKFVYNTSSSDNLSTDKDIKVMEGIDVGTGAGDDLPWMAAAYWDGTTGGFKGIIVWCFTGDTITDGNNVASNGHPVDKAKSIFYPDNQGNTFNRVYSYIISDDGSCSVYDESGNCGWNYSNGQAPSTKGYNSNSDFSGDDGAFAIRITGNSGSGLKIDGNAPGPSSLTGNYGAGNYDSGDSSAQFAWGGGSDLGGNWVGYIFTGDK